jgi:hypothetical protein
MEFWFEFGEIVINQVTLNLELLVTSGMSLEGVCHELEGVYHEFGGRVA